MQVLLASDRRPQPWRNGGGVTFPVAAQPRDAGAGGDFDWRVSVAEIAEDGDFSSFPLMERQITILDGVGVDLTIDGDVVELRPGLVRSFRGESAVSARLIDGSTLDLNLMTRRGRASGSIRLTDLAGGGARIGDGADVTILIVVRGSVSCDEISLNTLDAIRLDPDDKLVTATGDAHMAIIELTAASIR